MWQKYNSFDSLKAKMRYLIDPSVSCKIATNDAPVSVATSRTSSTDKWMSQTKHRMPNDQSWCAKFNFFFTNNSWWTLVRKIINCVRNRRKFSFVDLKSLIRPSLQIAAKKTKLLLPFLDILNRFLPVFFSWATVVSIGVFLSHIYSFSYSGV